MNIGFASTEIAALDRVIEETKDAVAVVLVILGRVDAALGSDAMGAARTVLKAEAVDFVAELGERCGRGSASEPRAHDDDSELAAIGRADQLHLKAMSRPFFGERALRNFCVEFNLHNTSA
jgi:hypothetical protein